MAEKKSVKKTVAAPKAAAKKTVSEKPAAKKTAAVKKTTAKKTASVKPEASQKSTGGLTRVIVKADAGWGNHFFIRGNGAGLSWHKGVLMQCIGAGEWIWENKVAKGTVEFKILVNDEIWSAGEDVSVDAGESVTCHPEF